MEKNEKKGNFKMKDKIKFGDLSTPLKVLVIFGWASLILYVGVFLIGFIAGYMGW